jgi:hypothetical protein
LLAFLLNPRYAIRVAKKKKRSHKKTKKPTWKIILRVLMDIAAFVASVSGIVQCVLEVMK